MSLISYLSQIVMSNLSTKAEYRGNLILFMFLSIVLDFVPVFITYSIYAVTDYGLPGWSFYEVLFIIGIYNIVLAFYSTFLERIGTFSQVIRKGDFDLELTKPLHPLIHFFNFNIHELGGFISGFVMLSIAAPNLEIQLSFLSIFSISLLVIMGVLSLITVNLIVASTAFFIIENEHIEHNLKDLRSKFAKWPMDIYPDWLRRFFTFIFPIAFIAYVPSAFILGKDIAVEYWFSPVIVFLVFYAAVRFFNYGVSKYSSTGT